MTISEDQHNELLQLVEEMKGYVEAGYSAPSDIFEWRLDRINQILLEDYDLE